MDPLEHRPDFRNNPDELRLFLTQYLPHHLWEAMLSEKGARVCDVHASYKAWVTRWTGMSSSCSHFTPNMFGRRLTRNEDLVVKTRTNDDRRVRATLSLLGARAIAHARVAQADSLVRPHPVANALHGALVPAIVLAMFDPLPFLCLFLAAVAFSVGWAYLKSQAAMRLLRAQYAAMLTRGNDLSDENKALREGRETLAAEVKGLRETMGEMDQMRELAPSIDLMRHYQTELIPGILAERDKWHDWYLRAQEQLGAGQQALEGALENAIVYFSRVGGKYPAVEESLAAVKDAMKPAPGSADERAYKALETALRAWEAKRRPWGQLEAAQRLVSGAKDRRVTLQAAAPIPPGTLVKSADGAPASYTPSAVPAVPRA